MAKKLVVMAALATTLGIAGASAQEITVAGTAQPRLTVFEGFFNPGCPVCGKAAAAVEQLVTQYPASTVLFLEDDLYNPKGDRKSRYLAVGSGWYFPFIMVNSGHQHVEGAPNGSSTDFVALYKGMVDAEKARPALVEVAAWYRRIGDTIKIYADVVNTTSVSLSPSAFPTWVHGIVWEEAKVAETNRYVRAAMVTPVPGLAPGARGGYTLESPALSPASWDKVFALAVVDYKPGGLTGSTYDMLQAAHAQPAAFTPSATQLGFTFPTSTPTAQIRFAGPYVLQWTATSDRPWLTVSPASGPLATPAVVTVDELALQVGENTGTLTFAATSPDGMSFTATVQVSATQTAPPRVQELPGVASAPGSNQTVWRSSATLYNPMTTPVSVKLEIVPRDSATVAASKQITLAASELKVISNLYQELSAPSGAGNLRVTGDALAWVRTFNQGEKGTFGQDLAGSGEVVFQADERVHFPIATATNLETQFRSNLLLLNLESTPIDVTLQSGNATKVISLPGRTYRQLDQVGKQQLGLPAGTSMLTVHATGTWVGYVSTVDPITGDPTTVRGQKVPAP
ncbi:MAG: BACON domain-containing protein [Thermoanaerobaculaceae bacterium]|nr:BACON domain-containing protein [Thermoanaerobaculaceae bacterium]MDI9623027.1 hypothetical protein [Acidobacteriota bacterium]NLH12084.1 BACON domain-containing protein [Holophagae bacterium]HPW55006.1 hypothetical protein [Thermoanaerobaculaceae bacterium]